MALATHQDVIACYRQILGRDPESADVVAQYVGRDIWSIVHDFSHSNEHRAKLGRSSSYSLLKCESPSYLAHGLPAVTRASALTNNISFFCDRLRPEALLDLLGPGLMVIDGLPQCPDLRIDLSMFTGPADEGEMSLQVDLGSKRLAVIGFTIVNGKDFCLVGGSALLVSRIQGYRGVADEVRAASRALGDIGPPRLLFAALEGLAAALGIKSLLCVPAHRHPSFGCASVDTEQLRRAYDQFCVSLGAVLLPSGLFHLSLPRADRSKEKASNKHRARARSRRATRRLLSARAELRCASFLSERRERPRPAPCSCLENSTQVETGSIAHPAEAKGASEARQTLGNDGASHSPLTWRKVRAIAAT